MNMAGFIQMLVIHVGYIDLWTSVCTPSLCRRCQVSRALY